MRCSAATLAGLVLSGCATVPPSACFFDLHDSQGWARLKTPPSGANAMRAMAHQTPSKSRQAHRAEYWFRHFDGRVMLCEGIVSAGCDTTNTIFNQSELGTPVIDDTGLERICISADDRTHNDQFERSRGASSVSQGVAR